MRGTPRVSPASGQIYLCCAEVLSLQITHNNEIKGIPIGDHVKTISQFTDDTGLFSLNDVNSLQAIINTFDRFQQNTGLKVDYEKTNLQTRSCQKCFTI